MSLKADPNNPYHRKEVVQRWNAGYRMPYNPYLHGRQQRLLEVVRKLGLAKDSVCLDFGCGGGQTVLELEKLGLIAYGVDVSEEFIASAKARAPENARANFQVHDLSRELPFEEATFDLIVGVGVLQYLPDPHACLRHLVRTLKPGGTLLVCHRNALSHKILVKRPGDFLLSLLSEEGFEFAGRHPQGVLKRMVKMSNLKRWLEQVNLEIVYQGQCTPHFSRWMRALDRFAEPRPWMHQFSPMIIVGGRKPR